ncbi:MAG: hypothetical protein Q9169_005389 [Polycauliona sp. 2 TL-2023]
MRECYQRAGLDPRDTQSFEAHGTGTAVGDPVEAGAVAAVFQAGRSAEQALRIGSVKTNVGHTGVTSGLAGIIKATLAMEKGLIPPSINFEKANEKIPFDTWRLKLVSDLEEWPTRPGGVRRASINNFGYGGTNAHLIMENGHAWMSTSTGFPWPADSENKSGVLVLSAKTEQACTKMVANLQKYLEQHKTTHGTERLLEAVVYTLGQRRTLFPWIAAHPISLTSGFDAVKSALDSPQFRSVRTSGKPRLGFVFTGQGAQWHAMGRELIGEYPIFEASLKNADLYLHELGAEWSLLEELQRDPGHSRVNDASMSIPICVALQIALVQLLRAWGIVPAAVTSHSSGEIAAAYAVGALSLKSAMAVAYHRTVITARQNLHRTTKGGMVAVGMAVEQAEASLAKLTGEGKAIVACINSPSSVTVAGDVSAVQEFEDMMKADSIFARRLRVDTAYHSHHMQSAAEPYHEALCCAQLARDIKQKPTSVAFSSPVTGGRIIDAEKIAQPSHWVDSMVQPVLFVDAFQDMVLGDFDPSGSSVDVLIEVGPHTALGSSIKEIMALPAFNGLQLPYHGCLVRNTDARYSMQDLAAKLLRHGQPLDTAAINFPRQTTPPTSVLTDLPSYPWVHQTRYWQESRFNRAIRDRSLPPHDFLGSIAPWANPAAPCWRQIVRVDDSPWLRDHIVESSVVYPGAGFVCLAIEAMAQMATMEGRDESIAGFRLRDIEMEMGLVIPENAEGIEIQTTLSPVSDKAVGSKDWKTFEIVSITSQGKWTRHAQGLIVGEFDGVSKTTVGMPINKPSGYTRHFDPDDFYATLRRIGLKQGPKFQNIKSIQQFSKAKLSVARFLVADTDTAESSPSRHVMHPITLTSIIQAAYTALPRAGSRLNNALVPRSIDELWVSNQISRESSHPFEARSNVTHADPQNVRAAVSVVDANNTGNAPAVLEMKGLVFQSFGGGASSKSTDKPWEEDVCSKLEWELDISLATPAQLGSLKQELARPLDQKETNIVMDLRRVCIYFMKDALAALSPSDVQQLDKYRAKYYSWLRAQIDLADTGRLGSGCAQWTQDGVSERARWIEAARGASVNGQMVCQLGPHLAAMIRGEQAPLEIMMEDRLLYRYYKDMLKISRSFEQSAALLKRLVHKNPRARILEIGAGTGGGTRYMLPTLGTTKTGGPLASLYHFTDVSAGFFAAASEEFSEWGDLLQFDKLDVETDPAGQGFELGSYDIVIACQVLHATKSMTNTMTNVRELMKPDGTLLLVETTKDQVDVQFVFGLLPGWWLSEEEERHSSPSLGISLWHQILQKTGYTGVNLEVHDCESEDMYSMSTIMSTSLPAQPPSIPSGEDVVIVTSIRNPPPQGWLDSLLASFKQKAPEKGFPTVGTLETASTAMYYGKICICIAEAAEVPLLYNLDSEGWEGTKAMATTCKGLLWITRGGSDTCEKPELGLAAGFLRTLRNEYVGRPYIALDLDPTTPVWSDLYLPAVVQVLETCFGSLNTASLGDSRASEHEYIQRKGSLLIPRFVKDISRNKALFPDQIDYSVPEDIAMEPFQQPTRPISLQVGVPGLLDTLVFADDERPCCQSDTLAAEMVEIRPQAYGVNPRDVMVAMGQAEEPAMGLECAGIITKVGNTAASQGFVSGDSVMCLLCGPFSSRVCVDWKAVVRMPAGMSFEEAASIPLAFTTAWYSLHEVARVKRGQSVLIHAAMDGNGQAATALARHIGAEIFATVDSIEERTILMESWGIPAEHIFSSRDVSFARDVMEATNGRGVDVVLNSLVGSMLQASFNVLAPFGHFIQLGRSDAERNSSLEMRTFARHTSFTAVDVLAMLRFRADDVRFMLAEVARLAMDKVVKPIQPLTVYPMAEVKEAFRLLQAGKHSGKVVLAISPHEEVALLPQRPKVRLSAHASYLLVGVTGQSTAIWMVEHGAKNLILLSGNPGQVDSSTDFPTQIQEAGCRVKAIDCDVSCGVELQRAMSSCQQEGFPPVRGIVYGATAFQDSILEEMSMQHYTCATSPYLGGTRNLHAYFPRADELDFFILLSSNAGILGSAGQAGHTAGVAYQDALAQWRGGRGLPCVSIDLGPVKTIGGGKEVVGAQARMAKLGNMWMDEDAVGDVLESAILKPQAQIMVGINGGPGWHWDGEGASQLGRDARFMGLRYRQQKQQQTGKRDGSEDGFVLANQLAEANSRSEAERLVGEAIGRKLTEIFGIPTEEMDISKAPTEYGVDSLVAVELRNMLMHQVGSEVASFSILQSVSLGELAKTAAGKSRHINPQQSLGHGSLSTPYPQLQDVMDTPPSRVGRDTFYWNVNDPRFPSTLAVHLGQSAADLSNLDKYGDLRVSMIVSMIALPVEDNLKLQHVGWRGGRRQKPFLILHESAMSWQWPLAQSLFTMRHVLSGLAWSTLAFLPSFTTALTLPSSNGPIRQSSSANVQIQQELATIICANSTIFSPDDTEWPGQIERYMQNVQPLPQLSVQPGCESDVQKIVQYANEHAVSFFAVSRGHAFSTSVGRFSGIEIDMRNLVGIHINPDNKTAHFQGGAYGDVVTTYLGDRGYVTASGGCKCVSVLGPALGGGHTLQQGQHGLIMDHFVSLNIVLANGSAINVDADSHPDLWWAVRGAGHNFGIVTSFDSKIWRDDSKKYSARTYQFSGSSLDALLEQVDVFQGNGTLDPVWLAAFGSYSMNSNAAVTWIFLHDGPLSATSRAALDPFDRLSPLSIDEVNVEYGALLDQLGGAVDGPACEPNMTHIIGTTYLQAYNTTTMREIYDLYNEKVRQYPGLRSGSVLVEGYAVKGVQSFESSDSAFAFRDQNILTVFDVVFNTTDDPLIALAEDWRDETMALFNAGQAGRKPRVYVNYAAGYESLEARYGYEPWRMDRLRQLKTQYDPYNRFAWYNPIIPPK